MQFNIAGVTHDGRQETLKRILEPGHQVLKSYGTVRLIPEPENPHDEKAIAVYARVPGEHAEELQLGYVPRKLTARLHGMMKEREIEARLIQIGPMKTKPGVISARVQARRKPIRRKAVQLS